MFSPWRFNTDAAARALLDAEGWTTPDPDAYPDRGGAGGALPRPARRHGGAARTHPHRGEGGRRRAA
jgi:hypothetical protein